MTSISDGGYVIFAKKRDKMAQKTIKARILLRADTATNLAFLNPVLYKNELAIEKDTGKKKLGDGSTSYNSLPYLEKTIWGEIENMPKAFTPAEHTHNYAGSSTPGGAATSANKLNTNAGNAGAPVYFKDGVPVECTSLSLEVQGNATTATTAEKLSSNAGSPTRPIYFSGGVPTNGTYELHATVPSDAKFTDTVYTHPSYEEKANGLYKVTVDAEGHVSSATAVTKSDITALGIPAQDTTYTHPYSHPASMITGLATVATSGKYSDLEGTPTSLTADGGNADTADALNTDAGSVTQPVYFKNGVPKATTYSLNKTVPANAVFTDTTYSTGSASTSGLTKLYSATGSATDGTMTQNAISEELEALRDEMGSVSTNLGEHTHNYAGSSSPGGAATSANKLNTNAGSATQPVYFSNGIPVKTTHTLGASVPSDAKFTDTTYTLGTETVVGLTKLYSDTGTNTDGTMTQNAISEMFTSLAEVDTSTLNAINALNESLSKISGNAYTKEEVDGLLGNVSVGELTFTSNEWSGNPVSGYTLSKELGLAKVIEIYKGDSTTGYQIIEADYINISAGGTLTITAPNSFDGFILLSSVSAFDNSVAETVDAVIDGKVEDSITANIGDRVNTAVDNKMTEHNADITAHETALANYVTLDSQQNISGTKIFTNPLYLPYTTPIRWFVNNIANGVRGYIDAAEYTGTAAIAKKLTTSAGSANTPVYFENGIPVECTGIGLDSVMPINYDDASTTTFGFEVINNELYLLSSLSEDSSAIATLNAQIPWSNIINSPFNTIYTAYPNGLWKFSTNEHGQVIGAEAVTHDDITNLGLFSSSGGNVAGTITSGAAVTLRRNVNDDVLQVSGGTGYTTSAYLYLTGQDSDEEGSFTLAASANNTIKKLKGKVDGTLTWNGSFTASSIYNAVYNDYAEFFPRGENTEPGDIIALDMNSEKEQYIKATSDSIVAGIHSDEFAHLIGGEEAPEGEDFVDYNMPNFIPVSLAGRVHVKVIGKVNKGDYIITSNIPGVGIANKNLTNQRNVVGYAVEPSDDENIKKVLVRVKGA